MAKEMKSNEVVLVGSAGFGTALAAHTLGAKTGNTYIDAGIGIVAALAGWFMDYDGLGDYVEGFGIGYFLASIL